VFIPDKIGLNRLNLGISAPVSAPGATSFLISSSFTKFDNAHHKILTKMVYAFFEHERREIRKVVDYSKQYIYQLDDILDMWNRQMATPGEDSGHSVRVGLGVWGFGYVITS
jgi:hypothetical protein